MEDKESVKFTDTHRITRDNEIKNYLLATTFTNRHNYTKYVLEENFDTLALLYTTDKVDET